MSNIEINTIKKLKNGKLLPYNTPKAEIQQYL